MQRNYWTVIAPDGYRNLAEHAQQLEDSGLTGVAVPQVYGSPFVPLAAVATSTKQLQLASGIAIGLTRSPFETAMSALDLDHIANGRFILGLGTGPRHWTNGYFGMPYDKPVSRLREVTQILRHVEEGARSGSMQPWEGRFHRLTFSSYQATIPPFRERIPVWIACLRERMCELAGEIADGLIGHPVWSVEWALGQAQQSLTTGAARAGRDASLLHFQPWVTVSIDSDTNVAVQQAKSFIAFYGGFAQYHSYFEAHGFGREAKKLEEASESMDCMKAAPLVPDEMARTFAACGTPDQVRERVEPLWKRANSMLILPPSWGLSPEQINAQMTMIGRTFWPN